jgi:hypothetical protein
MFAMIACDNHEWPNKALVMNDHDRTKRKKEINKNELTYLGQTVT